MLNGLELNLVQFTLIKFLNFFYICAAAQHPAPAYNTVRPFQASPSSVIYGHGGTAPPQIRDPYQQQVSDGCDCNRGTENNTFCHISQSL